MVLQISNLTQNPKIVVTQRYLGANGPLDPSDLTGYYLLGTGDRLVFCFALQGTFAAESLAKSYTKTFVTTFGKMALYIPFSYGFSVGWSALSNFLGWSW